MVVSCVKGGNLMKKTYAEPRAEFVLFNDDNQLLTTNSPCSCDLCDNSIGIECVNCVYD